MKNVFAIEKRMHRISSHGNIPKTVLSEHKKAGIRYCTIATTKNMNQQRMVISFLSPSLGACHVAQDKLGSLLGWKAVDAVTPSKQPSSWQGAAVECPHNGTILQWITMNSSSSTAATAVDGCKDNALTQRNPFRLLAIQQQGATTASLDETALALAESLAETSSKTRLTLKRMFQQPITVRDVLGKGSLPVLQLGGSVDDEIQPQTTFTPGCLKEIAIPTYEHARYSDGRTLRDYLSQAPLYRPVTGLYQTSSGVCIRPIPMGVEDRQWSPPSLVFHADPQNEENHLEENDSNGKTLNEMVVSKIGYNGISRGQVMVRSHHWLGIDIRLCPQTVYKSGFAEAQEALLAGSLPSLQSHHVLDGARGTIDPKTNQMDCWYVGIIVFHGEWRSCVANRNIFSLVWFERIFSLKGTHDYAVISFQSCIGLSFENQSRILSGFGPKRKAVLGLPKHRICLTNNRIKKFILYFVQTTNKRGGELEWKGEILILSKSPCYKLFYGPKPNHFFFSSCL